MALPSGFRFSQGSLQAYIDCPRRFQLRYVRRLRWPAVETEPFLENEGHLRQGEAFHRLVRQHLTGIPSETLWKATTDPKLRRWWQSYLKLGLVDVPSQRYPEVRLSTSIGGYRLVAQYDVIAADPGRRIAIVDWKTDHQRPRRRRLSERLQTRVYPYVAVESGGVFNGRRGIEPGLVTMIYWFANFPSNPERFCYDDAQYQADEAYLLNLVDEIEHKIKACDDDVLLPPVEDQRRCSICRYRSLCERGVEPGRLDEREREESAEELFDFALDFEQIGEVEVG